MSPDKIRFPSWVPADAQQMCTIIYSVAQDTSIPFPEALQVLQRLAMRLEMKDAWGKLKYFAGISPRDLIMTTFLVWLCATHNRLLGLAPRFKSDHDGRELASMARVLADTLRTTGPEILAEVNITEATLRELERVAAFYEGKVKNFDVLLRIAPPPKKARAHNADEVAFVYTMCDSLGRQAGRRRPYVLVAILANVAFNVSAERQWDADRVKQCLRTRSSKKVGPCLGNI
jgi:hypothetical protein